MLECGFQHIARMQATGLSSNPNGVAAYSPRFAEPASHEPARRTLGNTRAKNQSRATDWEAYVLLTPRDQKQGRRNPDRVEFKGALLHSKGSPNPWLMIQPLWG